jgi:hypothetical protein
MIRRSLSYTQQGQNQYHRQTTVLRKENHLARP